MTMMTMIIIVHICENYCDDNDDETWQVARWWQGDKRQARSASMQMIHSFSTDTRPENLINLDGNGNFDGNDNQVVIW